MYYVFYKTTDVFAVEELLSSLGIVVDVVPTPVQDKAYCGVCLKVSDQIEGIAQVISAFEYKIID